MTQIEIFADKPIRMDEENVKYLVLSDLNENDFENDEGQNISGSIKGILSVEPEEGHVLYLALSIIVIIIFIGSLGNILVIYIVKTTTKLHIISNVFIVNLSICDLLFLSCVLPFNIYTFKSDGWYLSKCLCKFVGFMGYTLTGTIIITITLIAFNRYKLVLDPSGYRRLYTRRNIALMITCAWIIPVACLLPALTEVWGKFGYVAMLVTCNLLLDHQSQSYKLFLLVVRAGIPCVLIVYYYAHIFITTHQSHMRIRYAQTKTSSSREARNHKKEMRLTRMMVIIFVVFILSYFPCTITGIIDWNTVLSKQFHMFCAITVYIGSALNPLIYGLMNSQFRNAYLRLLCCNKFTTHKATRKDGQTEKPDTKSMVYNGKCTQKSEKYHSQITENETKEKLFDSDKKMDLCDCSSCEDSEFIMIPTEYHITVTFNNDPHCNDNSSK